MDSGRLQSLRLQRIRHDWVTNTGTALPGDQIVLIFLSSGIYFNSFNPHLHASTPPISVFLMFKHYAHVS